MKIDFLKEGSRDCPLVRLYEFDRSEAHRLRQAFQSLADDRVEACALDTVQSVDGTQLTFVCSTRDQGVNEASPHCFVVALTVEGWRQAADLMKPFCDGGFGHQWLTPRTSGIQLLITTDGTW